MEKENKKSLKEKSIEFIFENDKSVVIEYYYKNKDVEQSVREAERDLKELISTPDGDICCSCRVVFDMIDIVFKKNFGFDDKQTGDKDEK